MKPSNFTIVLGITSLLLVTVSCGLSTTKSTATTANTKWEYGELAQIYWKQDGYSFYWETGEGTINGQDFAEVLKAIDGTEGSTSTDILNALGKQGWVLVNFDRSIDGHYGSALIWTLKREIGE